MAIRSISLIEQKKLQWSREKEEMTKFYGLWIPINQISVGPRNSVNYSHSAQLNKLKDEYVAVDDCCSAENCLPPIQKSVFSDEYIRPDVNKNNIEYNTSGYVSETDVKDELGQEKKKQWKSQSSLLSDTCSVISKSSSYIDDISSRLKWGDRGIGVGHLWEPTANSDARLPEINNRPGTPHWLQKNLLNKFQHLRGQNVPIEPTELREREQKRQKAVELQEAIRQQLLERDKKRKEDRDLQIREEKQLERRISEQHEMERNRLEEEITKQKEKQDKENKKSKAMLDALAIAEQQAKEAKNKLKSRVFGNIQTPAAAEEEKDKSQQLATENKEPFSDNVIANNKTNDALIPAELIKRTTTCDGHTSLTLDNYFKEFKCRIPLVTNSWTQTRYSCCCSPKKCWKKNIKSNNDRPKWGVNRPNKKYMKQSEKDPFYWRRLKHRSFYHRCPSEQEPSGSSRSLDSTDEYKSNSSSPQDFNGVMPEINLNLTSFKNKFKASYPDNKKIMAAVDYDSDKCQEESIIQIKMGRELDHEEKGASSKLSKLSNKSKMKKFPWENEMKKISSDMKSISLEAN